VPDDEGIGFLWDVVARVAVRSEPTAEGATLDRLMMPLLSGFSRGA
jgi:hypothetical protein